MAAPRPRDPRKTNGIRLASFSEETGGLLVAQQRATEWMNGYQGLDLITINSCITPTAAVVTVWYRVKTKPAAAVPPVLPPKDP